MTESRHHLPEFRELSDSESRVVLKAHSVGRLADTWHDRVDIVHDIYDSTSVRE